MRRIDELHLKHPFLGARRPARMLQREGAPPLTSMLGVTGSDVARLYIYGQEYQVWLYGAARPVFVPIRTR
jgi:hypothetical protein